MSKISRPDTTEDLVSFFLSAGESPTPGELSEEVLFTFPFSAPTTQLRFAIQEQVSGAAGVALLQFGTVPDGEYWLYHAADIDHNDATARPAFWVLSDTVGGTVVRIVFEASLTSTGFLTVRNVVVPPLWALRGQLNAITGASVMAIRGMKTEHKIAQPLMGTSS